MKKCSYCKEFKSLDCFGKHRKHKDGLQSVCKECKKITDKKYRTNNHEKVLQMKKNYRENNKEKVYNQKRKCYLAKRDWYLNKFKNYREIHKDEINNYCNEKYKNNVNYRIAKLLRGRILKVLGRFYKSDKTMKLIGCSLEQLKQRLQKTAISNGYLDFNINTYSGKEYHIDHIMPCSIFDLSKEEEQKKCFNWRNLQILTAHENISKSSSTPYQPL